jgi:hypothetical protein
MRLVYTKDQSPVHRGDLVQVNDTLYAVDDFPWPHKPESSGKVYLRTVGEDAGGAVYYVGVIGATWIEREDRE